MRFTAEAADRTPAGSGVPPTDRTGCPPASQSLTQSGESRPTAARASRPGTDWPTYSLDRVSCASLRSRVRMSSTDLTLPLGEDGRRPHISLRAAHRGGLTSVSRRTGSLCTVFRGGNRRGTSRQHRTVQSVRGVLERASRFEDPELGVVGHASDRSADPGGGQAYLD